MQIRENISLRPYNTFRIDASCRYFATFANVQDALTLLDFAARNQVPETLVLGGGSNILLTRNFDGLVLRNEIPEVRIVKEDPHYVYVKAGAGVNWHQFVTYCVQNNFGGVENLALIPGSVGASPMQNIGAYGVEIKDVFEELEALHIASKTVHAFSLNDCVFGYRDSAFKKQYKGQYIILSVTYRLRRQPHFNTSYGAIRQELDSMDVKELNIQAIAQAVINIRTSKLPDPAVIGNAGSFFKNPTITHREFETLSEKFPEVPHFKVDDGHVKVPAGWLIEQCGWKGYREGDAGCYSKQALVLVNYGNASGKEIYDLSEAILHSVREKFDITLEREVNIL